MVVVVAAAFVVSNTMFSPPSEECRPVNDLLAFNQSEAERIAEKTENSEGVPSAADEAAYRVWADGLADRAQQVSDPNLVRTSAQVADLADQFVSKMATLRAEAQSRAPGAPPPPVLYEMDALSDRITQSIAELSDACT